MLKSIRLLLLSLVALSATTFAQTDAQKAFTSIKSLPGTWEQKTAEGTLRVTFKVISSGSAVMSEIMGHGGAEGMITMFHMDGPEKLLMTHYCDAGNQPRMQATISPDARTITFTYMDATNLDAPDAGHMQKMVLTVLDENHHTEEWTFLDHGKEIKRSFDLRRTL